MAGVHAAAKVFTDPTFSTLAASIGQSRRERAPVRLVRAEHLLERWAAQQPLLSRNDCPSDAFYDGPLDPQRQFVVAISYAWLTAAHPDPELYHLRTLAGLLRAFCARNPAMQVLIFIVHD